MSPDNGILFNGVLKPKLLKILFACLFVNLVFLLPHTAYFEIDITIVLPFFIITFESTCHVSFLHFKEYISMFYNN